MGFGEADARSSVTQLLPPLLLALPLLATRGTPLLAGACVVVVAFLWSAVRLLRIALRGDRTARRLRSVITLGLAPVVLGLAWLQGAPVAGYLNSLAGQLQQQCRGTGKCPARIAMWEEASGVTGSSAQMGGRVRYAVDYRTDGRRFALCWHVAGDTCRVASGGVDRPLQAMQPWPWPQVGAAAELP
jgi:hypothetical protein